MGWVAETVCAPIRVERQQVRCRGADVALARFGSELHLTVTPRGPGSLDEQLATLLDAYRGALRDAGLEPESAVLRRFYASDLANQAALLAGTPLASRAAGAVSWVGQSPSPPAKLALWAWHIDAGQRELGPGHLSLRRDGLTHHWTCGVAAPGPESAEEQTRRVLAEYERRLDGWGMSLADHLVRTWFFVPHIDRNYAGLVTARREFFAARGLLPETHYVASTGIEGREVDPAALVLLDAYAIAGLRPAQVSYLKAPERLSPTHLYGVTFERGTAIDYTDRRQVFISGTASIDAAGRIVHPGDVSRQLERTLDNVAALLAVAGAGLDDVLSYAVYLRDPADHALVWRGLRERCGGAPMTVVAAPVCRPGWLVEVECVAMTTPA